MAGHHLQVIEGAKKLGVSGEGQVAAGDRVDGRPQPLDGCLQTRT
ncbi:hypothetical protein [Mycolicibacterium aichiense]|nr:hypothetical protein [Mycolicibacterium aichiense]